MPNRNLLLTLSSTCLVMACASDGGMQTGPQATASPAPIAQPAPQVATSAPKPAPIARGPVVFNDLPSFDRELGQSLSGAKDPVVVTSADRIALQKLPPRLEKWLAAVDDGGGKIETVAENPAAEPQTRSIGLIFALIGAIRQAREFTREHQYSEARNFDAKIIYRTDAGGDRVMESIELVRRQR